MPRLIDADKLRKHKYRSVQYERAIVNEISNEPTYAFMCGWNDAIDSIVENAPTVDAEPVRHGHWINHHDDLFPEESTQECSVCHAEQMATMLDDNYCPHCGAKMDERREDES